MDRRVFLTPKFKEDYAAIKDKRVVRDAIDEAMRDIANSPNLSVHHDDEALSAKLKDYRERRLGSGLFLVFAATDSEVCFAMLRSASEPPASLETRGESLLRDSDCDEGSESPVSEGIAAPLIEVPEDLTAPRWVLELPICEALKLSGRTKDALAELKCVTVGDLARVDQSEIESFKGLGDGAVKRIRERVKNRVFSLNGNEGIEEAMLGYLGDGYVRESPLPDPMIFQGHLSQVLQVASRGSSAVSVPIDIAVMRAAMFQELAGHVRAPGATLGEFLDMGSGAVVAEATGIALALVHSKSLIPEGSTLEQLISRCAVDARTNLLPEQLDVFHLAHGTNGHKLTHKEIQEKTGLSQSTVQYANRRVSLALDLERSARFLYVRTVILDEAMSLGGVGSAEILGQKVAARMGDNSFANAHIFSPDLLLEAKQGEFEVKSIPCRRCDDLAATLRASFTKSAPMGITDVTTIVGCRSCKSGIRPGKALVDLIAKDLKKAPQN